VYVDEIETSLDSRGAKNYQLLPSRWYPNSEPTPPPTIVLIVVQMYALLTVDFHRFRPQEHNYSVGVGAGNYS
jgi:hypothetical protein